MICQLNFLFLFKTKLKKKIFHARIGINSCEPEVGAYSKFDHIRPLLKPIQEPLWMQKALFSYQAQAWAQLKNCT